MTKKVEEQMAANSKVTKIESISRTGLAVIYLELDENLKETGKELDDILRARNISTPGGQVNVEGKNVTIDPSGKFKSGDEIGDVLVPTNAGRAVYLRDIADVVRSYDAPARYLNYFNWRDEAGEWHRSRAITLSVQMRSGEQIDKFGHAIDETLAGLKQQLPADLIYARTSDQPLQVKESIDLFMTSLYEAIILGVISLVGVIVSHIIVLFDFIEEKHAEGEPLVEALPDAGIMRLRPVLITVGATVFALFPLASHGGPLWEPMCYAQISGLCAATFITLLLVPVLYAIFVLDLKLVKWETVGGHAGEDSFDGRQPPSVVEQRDAGVETKL
ncbi:MAG TPA: efflux RND transporter permease subunit [Pyrinomonadaceae bacterium]